MSSRIRLFGIFYKHCVYCINYYMKFNVFIFYSTQNAFGSNEADAYIRIIQLLSRAQIASLTFNSKKINYQSFYKPSDSDRKNSKKKQRDNIAWFFFKQLFRVISIFSSLCSIFTACNFLVALCSGHQNANSNFHKKAQA